MHQPDFIRLCLELGVLRFGEFTLKSGRKSPYFFNAGLVNTGHAIGSLGRFYARAAMLSGVSFDMLFGPAWHVCCLFGDAVCTAGSAVRESVEILRSQ